MFVIQDVETEKYFAGFERGQDIWVEDIDQARKYANPFSIIQAMKRAGYNVTHVLLKEEDQ